MSNIKYYISAITAFTIWGTFSLVLKPLHDFSSFDILFYRVFSCAIIMTFISLIFRIKALKETIKTIKSFPKNERRKFFLSNLAGSLLLAFNYFSFIYVMNHVSVRATSIAYLICPILTMVLASFILKEKLSKIQWIAVGISLFGCILLSYSSLQTMFYSTIVGLSYAFYLIIQKQNAKFDKFLILNFHLLVGALVLLPFFPNYSGAFITDFRFYFFVEIIAVVYTIIPLFLNLFALSVLSSARVGILININPIIAFILAGAVYHEALSPIQITAYLVIFIAVIVFNSKEIFRVKERV